MRAKQARAPAPPARFPAGTVAAVVLAVVVPCLPLAPSLFGGKALLPADTLLLMPPFDALAQLACPGFRGPEHVILDPIQQYWPWKVFARRCLREGEVPLWNPYAYCGTPFIANQQSAVFYPANVLHWLLPPEVAFGWVAALNRAIGALFALAFFRRLGLAPVAALSGSTAFTLCGYATVTTEFYAIASAVAWLPALLWCCEVLRARPRVAVAVLCGGLVGVSLLAGHPQLEAYNLLVVTGYALWRLGGRGEADRGPRERLARLGLFGTMIAVGLAIGAVQLLPGIELGRVNYYASLGRTYEQHLANALPARQALTYLVPDLFGTSGPKLGLYWGHYNIYETCCYVGIPTLILAALALLRPRPRPTAALLVIAGVGLLLLFRTHAQALPYYLLPGFRQLANVARIAIVASFGLAGLAALGLDRLTKRDESLAPRLPGFIAAAVAALAAGTFLAWYVGGTAFMVLRPDQLQGELLDAYVNQEILKCVAFAVLSLAALGGLAWRKLGPQAAAWALWIVLTADLLAFGYGFNPQVSRELVSLPTGTISRLQAEREPFRLASPTSPGARFFKDRLAPNIPMAYGLADILGSDSLVTSRAWRLSRATIPPGAGPEAEREFPDVHRVASPLADLLNVRFVLTRLDLRPVSKLRPVPTLEQCLYENRRALPRAFLAERTVLGDGEVALRRLGQSDFSPRREVFVAEQALVRDRWASGQARVAAYGANRVAVSVEGRGEALLVLSDSHDPGWRCFVDGRPAPLHRVDYNLRGVVLPTAGSHRVEFAYLPGSFAAGLFLSLLGAGAMAAAAGALLVARRRCG